MPLRGKAGSKLQAAKTPHRPAGLGVLAFDVVSIEVDVGERTVGFQSICERLSWEQRGREQATIRISVTVKAPAFHRAEHRPRWEKATRISSFVIVSFSPSA